MCDVVRGGKGSRFNGCFDEVSSIFYLADLSIPTAVPEIVVK